MFVFLVIFLEHRLGFNLKKFAQSIFFKQSCPSCPSNTEDIHLQLRFSSLEKKFEYIKLTQYFGSSLTQCLLLLEYNLSMFPFVGKYRPITRCSSSFVNLSMSPQGASINPLSGCTAPSPLMCAVKNGHHDAIKFLLQRGALIDFTDSYHRTCLHVAAHSGNADTVDIILKVIKSQLRQT